MVRNRTDNIIHPFSIPASSVQGRQGAVTYLQYSTCERLGTPWTGRQSMAGQHRDTQGKQPCTYPFLTKGNLERPFNLAVMFLDCGRKPEYPMRTHACTGITCNLHAERTFLLQAT
ncbi:hypothetical protein ATANTOWER_032270 [Ataeniobius toweri]|uniref:Uncharacterized protein n=1 Tax=Ataeniobius toweri TaxID=208326 RepID=A0ABU7B643_9TELE|nr:hypothetical protein [Ataeniobius toweri]